MELDENESAEHTWAAMAYLLVLIFPIIGALGLAAVKGRSSRFVLSHCLSAVVIAVGWIAVLSVSEALGPGLWSETLETAAMVLGFGGLLFGAYRARSGSMMLDWRSS